MKDIENAYKSEMEYKRLRADGIKTLDLLDRVQEYGFDTLEEYFNDKIDYQIKNTPFTFQEVYPENAAEEMMKMISKGEAGLLLMNTDKTVVYHGDGYYNKEYCVEHNIPVIEYLTIGGTLVASSGELSIGVCIPRDIDVSLDWLLHKIADYLSQYEGEVIVDKNDLLINGNKICGAAVYKDDKSFSAVAQLSFDDKSELIRNICGANKGKNPSWLTNVTREQCREALKKWLL